MLIFTIDLSFEIQSIMKKISLFTLLICTIFAVNAQTTDDEIDYIQALFGMEKRLAVKNFMILEDSEKENFWKLYDEYEIIRKDYGKLRIKLLDIFVEQYDKMSDEESDLWMKSIIDLRKKNEKLIESYYKKIRKVCSASVAMQFYQVESYVLAGIRYQILESVPF